MPTFFFVACFCHDRLEDVRGSARGRPLDRQACRSSFPPDQEIGPVCPCQRTTLLSSISDVDELPQSRRKSSRSRTGATTMRPSAVWVVLLLLCTGYASLATARRLQLQGKRNTSLQNDLYPARVLARSFAAKQLLATCCSGAGSDQCSPLLHCA